MGMNLWSIKKLSIDSFLYFAAILET